jgi:hypothetical protein
MNSGKQKLLMFCAMVVFSLTAVSAFSQVNLGNNTNWKVYNVKPATSSFWDINKAAVASNDLSLSFPIQPFLTDFSTNKAASFAVYLLANDNNDITGKTFAANLGWIAATYSTRSATCPGAYVRFEFQDVTSGPYDSNDYWWSTDNLDLNGFPASGLVTSLIDRTKWTNQAGKSATDTTPNWVDWTTAIVAMSPYDGFTKAMKNVKQVGLSFGSSCSYASGVASSSATAVPFTVSKFTITP